MRDRLAPLGVWSAPSLHLRFAGVFAADGVDEMSTNIAGPSPPEADSALYNCSEFVGRNPRGFDTISEKNSRHSPKADRALRDAASISNISPVPFQKSSYVLHS